MVDVTFSIHSLLIQALKEQNKLRSLGLDSASLGSRSLDLSLECRAPTQQQTRECIQMVPALASGMCQGFPCVVKYWCISSAKVSSSRTQIRSRFLQWVLRILLRVVSKHSYLGSLG